MNLVSQRLFLLPQQLVHLGVLDLKRVHLLRRPLNLLHLLAVLNSWAVHEWVRVVASALGEKCARVFCCTVPYRCVQCHVMPCRALACRVVNLVIAVVAALFLFPFLQFIQFFLEALHLGTLVEDLSGVAWCGTAKQGTMWYAAVGQFAHIVCCCFFFTVKSRHRTSKLATTPLSPT